MSVIRSMEFSPPQPAAAPQVHVVRIARGRWLLQTEQMLPADLVADVFPFFSRPENLEELTPPFLRFRILTPSPIAMEEGALIDYRLRVRGLPIRWRTRISAFEAPHRFVDEQIRGPYTLWRHEHIFERCPGATRCIDRVEYSVPGGALANALLVKRELVRIFQYRRDALRERFSGQ